MKPDHVWAAVREHLRQLSPGTRVAYERSSLPHPRAVGARVSGSLPIGQHADYRFPRGSPCHGLHVREFEDRWVVEEDESSDGYQPASGGHVAGATGGALLGTAIGAAVGRSREAAVLGGLLGLIAGAVIVHQAGLVRDQGDD